jgi:hypothetical protein
VLSAALLAAGNANAAEEEPSVTALLKQGYAIVGIVPSTAGPGIFLKKGDVLIACFVAETSSSNDIATKYCKPVR